MNELVSIIILYYKDKDNIGNCIESVINQDHSRIETIIVDNNSNDGVVAELRNQFTTIKYIVLPENRGFCGGNNVGLKYAKGEYVLFLNTDVILERDYVSKMLHPMRINERIGLVSGKLMRFDHKTIDSAGLFISKNFSLIDRGFDEFDLGKYNTPGYVFGCCGAVFFARMSAVLKILDNGQLFDETFFAFLEDGDVSYRMHSHSYDVWYEPSGIAYHARGASSTGHENRRFLNKSNFYKYLILKNRYFFIIKNFSYGFILRNSIRLMSIEVLILGYIIFHPSLINIYISVLKSFRNLYQKRKILAQHNHLIDQKEMYRWILTRN
jgi:GT2 family glycosyltransferase